MPLPIECRSPIIFKYNLDLGRQGLLIKSKAILLIFLMYFSIVVKLEGLASLLIMMLTLLFETWRKSAITSDLIFLRQLLMLAIYWCTDWTINSALDFTIRIITYFLDGSLVIMLILGFFFSLLLFIAFIILSTLLADKDGKASLICKTFSMLGEIFDFKTCA